MTAGAGARAVPRLAVAAALALAGAALAAWWWSHFCEFPAMVWNDIRVAPAIAFARGLPVLATADHGPINTWTYGPLPLLYLWPASWAASAGHALLVAGALNLALIVGPVALVCAAWPATDGAGDPRIPRLLAFLLTAALWLRESYAIYYPDSLAVACGLLANLVLIRGAGGGRAWVAAGLATAAVACKQTALGIPLAQVLWLGFTAGWITAARQALRCVLCGIGLGAILAAIFGPAELWFVMVALPAHFPWVPDPLERLTGVAPQLALHVLAPAAVITAGWRAIVRSTLYLPTLTWLCCLPLGLAALLKWGGRMNSMHGFLLWLPAALVVALTSEAFARRRGLRLGAALAAAALGTGRVAAEPFFAVRPQTASYREADALAARFRGQIWFPFHPVVTLYHEGRYYHDEDGLHVWLKVFGRVPPDHLASGLPPAIRLVALRTGWTDWAIGRNLLQPARPVVAGDWTLYVHESQTPP